MDSREVLDAALAVVDGNQAELARRLGRSETTVSRWRNERNGIDMESALRIARLTGLPAREVAAACGLDPTLIPQATTSDGLDPELTTLIAMLTKAWHYLPAGIRYSIMVLARDGGRVSGPTRPRVTGRPPSQRVVERDGVDGTKDALAVRYSDLDGLITTTAILRAAA